MCCWGRAHWVLPVAEAVCIVMRIPSDHGYEGVADQPYHQDNLADGEVELSHSEVSDGQNIEDAARVSTRYRIAGDAVPIDHHDNDNDCRHRYAIRPIREKYIDCDNFVRNPQSYLSQLPTTLSGEYSPIVRKKFHPMAKPRASSTQ